MPFSQRKYHEEYFSMTTVLCIFYVQVKDCILRIRKGMVVSGVEALAVAMLLQTSGNVRRQVSNTAQEFQDRQSVLEPIVDMVGPLKYFRGHAAT